MKMVQSFSIRMVLTLQLRYKMYNHIQFDLIKTEYYVCILFREFVSLYQSISVCRTVSHNKKNKKAFMNSTPEGRLIIISFL